MSGPLAGKVALVTGAAHGIGRAIQRDEAANEQWRTKRWPALKKSRREGRTIVFIGECGSSERPTRVKTWAPKGQTPVL